MWRLRWSLVAVWFVLACAAALPAGSTASAGLSCAAAPGLAAVGGPEPGFSWRAGIEADTPVYDGLPGSGERPARWLSPAEALWLMVLGRPRVAGGSCWLRVRLPWRPNDASGWVSADAVTLERTIWRIEVSTARRTLTLLRAGSPVETVSAVVGRPSTPTPDGLFAVVWAIPGRAGEFLGSWVLELTAHSDVLRRFEGGDGTVGIHGRGGASLLDPLGSALSHGCIRLANEAIDRLVATVGEQQLPGTPVQIG